MSARKGAAASSAPKPAAAKAVTTAKKTSTAPLSKAKTKAAFEEAASLGIVTRSNMTGLKVQEKIEQLKLGVPLTEINPAPRGSKNGTAKATGKVSRTKVKAVTKGSKKFYLYAVDGKELSFLVESHGINGQIAVINAVKNGALAPNTPVVPIAPSAVERIVTVTPKERDPVYEVATSASKRRAAPKKAAAAAKADATVAVGQTPPAPGEVQENPFIGQ